MFVFWHSHKIGAPDVAVTKSHKWFVLNAYYKVFSGFSIFVGAVGASSHFSTHNTLHKFFRPIVGHSVPVKKPGQMAAEKLNKTK